MLWSKRITSETFSVGLLAGAGLTIPGLHAGLLAGAGPTIPGLCQGGNTQIKPVLAFMVPVDTSAGKLAVVILAVAFLIGFILWSKQTKSASFFRGVLAGMGFVLSVDIVLVHWIFGLHHITNTQMDIVLEPLFVVLGLVFLWFAITRERHYVEELRPNVMR